jgi:WD40 repeat protein
MRRIIFDPDALGTEDFITNLQFSRDGKTLAGIVRASVGYRDLRIVRYDTQGDIVLPNAHDYDIAVDTVDEPLAVVWCPDLEVMAEHFLTDAGFRNLRLVDFWSKPVHEVPLTEDFHAQLCGFSQDGSLLFIAGTTWPEAELEVRGYSVELLLAEDANALQSTHRSEIDHAFSSVASSPNGRWLAWGFENGTVILHDNTNEQVDLKFPKFAQQAWTIEGLQFSPKSDGLLSVVNGTVAFWMKGEFGPTVVRDQSPFCDASYLPDGQVLAATEAGDVVWIEAKTGAELKRLNFDVGQVSGLAVAPDGMTAALGCTGGVVVLFDLE